MPFEQHDIFAQPPDEAILWRYMDFTKFVSLLDRSTLYFARADTLGDRFEGSYSRANAELRPVWAQEQGLPADVFDDLSEARKLGPLTHFISSWHWNDVESAAMWNLYLRSGDGIAIRSTFGRLCKSLSDDPHRVYAGLVRYIDYETTAIPEANTFWPFVHKRRSFEHEREVRAVIAEFEYFHNLRARMKSEWRAQALALKEIDDSPDLDIDEVLPLPPSGLHIAADLAELIEAVYVAPTAAPWFADLTRSVMHRYDRTEPVHQSSLSADPVY
jgi:hypothetical protein